MLPMGRCHDESEERMNPFVATILFVLFAVACTTLGYGLASYL
jgi:hypothetical protein